MTSERTCRLCGCTEHNACVDDRGPCWWVEQDLCSHCPRFALSIRQPWAWAVIYGGKDIENRSWRLPNPALGYRGDFAVHAAIGMTQVEYWHGFVFMAALGVKCPPPAELQRGGIIGVANLVDIVKDHASDWFMGSRGLVLANPRPTPFVPSVGALGFFAWQRSVIGGMPPPAKWMTAAAKAAESPIEARQADLLD